MGRMSQSDFYYGSILNEILQNNPKATPTLISYEKDKRQVYKIYSEEIKKEYFLFFKYANMRKPRDEKKYRSWTFTFSEDDKSKLEEYHKKHMPIFLCLLCIGLDYTQSKIAILEYSEYKQVKNKSSITINLESGRRSFGLFPGEDKARQNTIKINTNRIDKGFEVLLNSYFQKSNIDNKILYTGSICFQVWILNIMKY